MFTRSHAQLSPAFIARTESPIGRIEITSDGDAITSLAIENAGELPFDELPEKSSRLLDLARKQLKEYFAGSRRTFELPIATHGTDFQEAIWSELSAIPFGEARTYGELGIASGRPAAGRAVGGAVAANPVPIIVPDHRVLGTDRRVTGYSGGNGVATKVWLLDHEGITHVG